MAQIKLPQEWRSWTIIGEIGQGSYGTVYRAEKVTGDIRTTSAIKVVRITADRVQMDGRPSEDDVRRYVKDLADGCANEIRAMYQLQGDSNIVSIQDHVIRETPGGASWELFIRMELLTSFEDYAVTRQFSQGDVIRLGISLCSALIKCEKYSIIHRDIKPANIFVTADGDYKLGDFGIARRLERATARYSSRGTFAYMAPEVFKGESYGQNVDVYSLGLVLYRLCNRNRDPFVDLNKQMVYSGDQSKALMRRVSGEKLPPPADADAALARIILKACAYDPSARYASAEQMKADLERIAPRYARARSGGKPAQARKKKNGSSAAPGPAPRRKKNRPHTALAVAATFTVLAVAAALALVFHFHGGGSPQTRDYSFEEFVLAMPEYYDASDDPDRLTCYADGNHVASLRFASREYAFSDASDAWKQEAVEDFVASLRASYEFVDDPAEIRDIEFGGLPGCAFDVRYRTAEDAPAYAVRAVFCGDAANRELIRVVLYVYAEAEHDFFADFDAMIASAEGRES